MKRFVLNTLSVLALSTVLSAYSCSPFLNYLVLFDKNNDDLGATEASPQFQRVEPHSMALGTLPEEPTRAGHQFVGWNTKPDGSGSAFDANTPVTNDITVYAQWQQLPPGAAQPLSLRILPGTTTLSPIESLNFSVTVTGFSSERDAKNVKLSVDSALPVKMESSLSANAKRFVVTARYDDAVAFDEGFVDLRLSLSNIPKGYSYAPKTQTLRIAVRDGLTPNLPIPVNQANIKAFNSYANTAQGLTRHYQLVESVVLPLIELNIPGNNWTAIGTTTAPFDGSFDGNNNSLLGLCFAYPDSNYRGLFDVIDRGAVIKNLRLLDVNVVGSAGIVGGVVGKNNGGTVQNCHVTGKFENYYANVGGVVGVNEGGTVRDCSMAGDINGAGSSLGGVVGINNNGTVVNCYAMGNVMGFSGVGGLVGLNEGVVQNSYATNNVDGHYYIGGVVGTNRKTVTNCYATGSVGGRFFSSYTVGGVAGQNDNGTIENCYVTGNVGDEQNWGRAGGVTGGGGTVRNCVALSKRIRTRDYATTVLFRIGGETTLMSYARDDMQLHLEDSLVDLSSVELGLSTVHGQSIARNDAHMGWWMTPSNWLTTDGASAWDFENVWEWASWHSNLPILRNVGGVQTPKAQ